MRRFMSSAVRLSLAFVSILACAATLTIAEETRALEPAGAPTLTVVEDGLGTAIEDRRLVGHTDAFREGDVVVYFTRVEGGAPGSRIDHVWLKDGEEVVKVGLAVNSASWRTWSKKTMHPDCAGTWSVEARDLAGNVLSSASFSCLGGETPVD